MRHSILALALSLSLGACVAPPGTWDEHGYEGYGTRNPRKSQSVESEYPLYARDGGVVEPSAPGTTTVTRDEQPTHDVEVDGPGAGTGRMYILELYQNAVDDRDSLSLEVTALAAALERSEAQVESLQVALQGERTAVEILGAERDRLLAEHQELTSRLVTAQIRRLESEKLLLESKLEWYGAGTALEARSPSPAVAPMNDGKPEEQTP